MKSQREKVLDEEYHLSYLIQFPKGKHCYHNTGKMAGIAEPLDPRVTDFIKTLIPSGCCRVKELESRAMDFVKTFYLKVFVVLIVTVKGITVNNVKL